MLAFGDRALLQVCALGRAAKQLMTSSDRQSMLTKLNTSYRFDFLPLEHRMIRRDGIWLFNIRYCGPVLTTWIGERMRMPVKYDPRNLSRVFLQGPDGQHWLPISDGHR